jgi:hypothetical protein
MHGLAFVLLFEGAVIFFGLVRLALPALIRPAIADSQALSSILPSDPATLRARRIDPRSRYFGTVRRNALSRSSQSSGPSITSKTFLAGTTIETPMFTASCLSDSSKREGKSQCPCISPRKWTVPNPEIMAGSPCAV